MTSSKGPNHVVVDGSNIATEGRSLPSLAQLNEAVMAFMEEHPNTSITVVVDATFGHRIEKSEAKEFEEGISNNELVAPPAGAVGRGDAFVLSIAQKANASILSNDSFQEFHGDYEWLFDEGRLIGGKPVPHVGWVFVDRLPVRGPVSRKATGSSSRSGGSRRGVKKETDTGRSGRKVSAEAMEPMPVPKTPPPGRKKADEPVMAPAATTPQDSTGGRRERVPKAGETVNELMPFLEFVEHHPVGTSVNGTVESYSSHGAYISIGENGVRGYVPLRLMSDPAPTSARKVMKLGESVTLVVVSFAPFRRSIDCAMPDMADRAIADAKAEQALEASAELEAETGGTAKAPAKKRAAKKTAASKAPPTKATAKKAPEKKTPTRKSAAKSAPAEDVSTDDVVAGTAAVEQAPARSGRAQKAPARKAPAKRAPAKKAAATKVPATTAPAESAPAPEAPATAAPVRKTPAKKSAAKKAPAKQAAAEKTAATKAPAKKTAATKVPAKKAPVKKAPATKAAAEKTAAKKSPAKKAPAKRTAPAGQDG